MKIKRKLLKKIILEALTSSTERGMAVKGMMPTSRYPDAVMVSLEDTKKLISVLGVTSKYKTKPQYVWKDAALPAGDLYGVGELTNGNGDPYTYSKVGSKYRVVTGPEAKTIGKVFSMDPPPQEQVLEVPEVSADEPMARPVNVLDMSMKDYANLYLQPEQLRIFNVWPIFSQNKDMTVQTWLSKDKEIIRDAVNFSQATAQRIQQGEAAVGGLRAPASLVNAYAAGSDNEEAMRLIYKTALDTIITDELKTAVEEMSN